MTIDWGRRELAHWCVRGLKRVLGCRGEDGQATLEFALVALPVFLIVLTGMVSLSLGLYAMQQVGNATSSASLAIAAQGRESTDPCAMIAPQITQMLPNLTPGNLSYSVTVTGASGTATTYGPFNPPSGGSCTPAGDATNAAAPMTQNQPVSVTISYTYAWLPFLQYSWVWSGPTSTLSSTQSDITE